MDGYSELELSKMTLSDIRFKFELVNLALNKDEKELEIYTLGGAGALLAGYFTRYTHDIDYIDLNYKAWQGKYLDLLGTQTDILEFSHTTISPTYKERVNTVYDGECLKVYVISKEDIVVSKLCRYAEKDQKDIRILMKTVDREILLRILNEVKSDISNRVPKIREQFLKNSLLLIEEYSLI